MSLSMELCILKWEVTPRTGDPEHVSVLVHEYWFMSCHLQVVLSWESMAYMAHR